MTGSTSKRSLLTCTGFYGTKYNTIQYNTIQYNTAILKVHKYKVKAA
jgi:hypothetical protein